MVLHTVFATQGQRYGWGCQAPLPRYKASWDRDRELRPGARKYEISGAAVGKDGHSELTRLRCSVLLGVACCARRQRCSGVEKQ